MNRLAINYGEAVCMVVLCGLVAFGITQVVPGYLAAISAHGVTFGPVAALMLIAFGGGVLFCSTVVVWVGTIADLRTSDER